MGALEEQKDWLKEYAKEEEVVSVKDLTITYETKGKKVEAVKGVSFHINAQDSLGIVGESGSGKSTLAMAILQLLPKKITTVTGEVHFNGKNLLALSEDKMQPMRWKDLSVVFQKSMNALSPVHKIGNQLVDIYRIHQPKVKKKEAKERIITLLDKVNLSPKVFNSYPHELSGGMMQRVSIALSLMHQPKLLILDEATTALDQVTQRQILEEIKSVEKEMNLTRLMITHDMSVVATSCNKVAVMYAGRIVEFGLVSNVLANPQHPYTKGLLKSIPSFKGEKENIRGIPGSIPDLSKEVSGCIFKDRCEFAMDICGQIVPGEINVESDHRVACHLIGGADYAS
ncbi:ABC transporter ATP-binding protein [Niallia sp. FSL W8-0635]|uniref:ABC transporter ATP-binding protein n=1 Tax=Niallia sp. FSL W8-0635 TaxID=2975337 RepID=UPI0030FB1590